MKQYQRGNLSLALRGVIAAVVVAAAVGPDALTPARAAGDVIRIGCFMPLSGPLTQYGNEMKAGMDLAVKDFEASGKLPAGVKIRLECEDSQGKPAEGVTIARKFVGDDGIKVVIGGFSSSVTMSGASSYDMGKLVHITPISSHPDITKLSPWVFRMSTTQRQVQDVDTDYALALGRKKVAAIAAPNDWGHAVMSNFKKFFDQKGGKVVFDEFSQPGQDDFKPILTKMKRSNPDMLFVGLYAPDAARFVKQAEQTGLGKVPTLLTVANFTEDFLHLAGSAAEGKYVPMTYNMKDARTAEWVNRWTKAHGRRPNLFQINPYNTTTLVLQIIAKQYPHLTRDGIRKALESVDTFDGVGGRFTYDHKTREWSFPMYRGVIRDGAFHLYE